MSDEEESRIEEALERVLDKRDVIDRETHQQHHRYIESWIERQENRRERWQSIVDRVKGTVIGAIILGISGWLLGNLEKLGRILSIFTGGGK